MFRDLFMNLASTARSRAFRLRVSWLSSLSAMKCSSRAPRSRPVMSFVHIPISTRFRRRSSPCRSSSTIRLHSTRAFASAIVSSTT